MEVGQRVYVQKDELAFHRWYEAHIVEIHVKNPQRRKARVGGTLTTFLPVVQKYMWNMLSDILTIPLKSSRSTELWNIYESAFRFNQE